MIDEKETAWLRLKALEIAGGYSVKGQPEDLSKKMRYADDIYGWAVSGVSPYAGEQP